MKKKIILLICTMLTFVLVSIAGTPLETLLSTNVATLATSAGQTVTVSNFVLNGDSIGVNVNFSVDSVSGWIYYDWVTADGNTSGTSRTFTLSDASTSFINTGSNKTVFTKNITRVAGVYRAYVYLYMVNNKTEAATQTITSKIYKVAWK